MVTINTALEIIRHKCTRFIIRRRTVEVPKTKPTALVKKRSYKFAANLPLRRITMIVAKNSVNYPYFKGVSNPRTRNIFMACALVGGAEITVSVSCLPDSFEALGADWRHIKK